MAADATSGVLTLVLAAFFLRLWRASRDPEHGLFALGFFLIGGTFPLVTASQIGLLESVDVVHSARLAGQLGGALVLALAYASTRVHGRSRPFVVLALTIVAALAVLVVVLAVPPRGSLEGMFAVAHATMVVAYGACAWLSFASVMRRPAGVSFLVPGAFVAWAISKYTWLLIDITADLRLVGFVYFWRYSAITLLLLAVALPARSRGGDRHAAA